jgi:predicted dehydrogenase
MQVLMSKKGTGSTSGKAAGNFTVRLAIIGCGAVAELCHLPGATLSQEVKIAALVDKNLARAQFLGEAFGVDVWTDDYRQLPDDVDGVINALPHHLHAPVTIEFLERGIPVLVEKPMALNLPEAEAMVRAAAANGVALQVGLMNRFCHGARLVKRAIAEGWLGEVQSFTMQWGFVYDWPVASGFFFSKEQAGGGVLMDLGSHVLDLLIWWFGDVVELEYKDDSLGGVEADCWLSLGLHGQAGSVQGTVTLSRLRRLSNKACVVGDRFTIECDIDNPVTARFWPTSSTDESLAFGLDFDSLPRQTLDEAYAEQLEAFAQTITTGNQPVVSGEQVLDSVALTDRCYRERQPLDFPWLRPVGLSHQEIG